ncbi:hypothetical protein [Desertivirga brevis]|uniref:hypothetical protein n=1 Tax=Desertivirga brevis TaxID=2810310 RepID=UPI001A957546|nr:hypothetical protein [Pedobacter sp. SYSU D00873]
MKTLLITIFSIVTFSTVQAQDFNKHLSTAKTAYSGKKLEEARFAMQQMLQELDIMAGKDILKMLPLKMDELNSNPKHDDVSGGSGFAGIIIHRDYGTGEKSAEVDIIGNSPLISSINALLALPFIANNANQKVIKLEGYKALLNINKDSETSKVTYEIQVPLNSSLLTLKAPSATEDEIKKFASTIPVAQLAKTLQ